MAKQKKDDSAQRIDAAPKGVNTEGDAGQAEVQERFDKASDQGHLGVKVDPTPNEHYTVDGVTSEKPTPETDQKLRDKAREALR